MKDSQESKDNLSKIRKCIVKGKHLTDIWNETVIREKIEACFTVMGRIVPLHETEEFDATESAEILQTEESEITGTTAEIFDSGIDHEM